MGESKAKRIERLLQEGLDHYGENEISTAIMAWEKVLELDPSHVEALDYIKTADRRYEPRPPKADKMVAAVATILQQTRELMQQGDYGAVLGLLRSTMGQGFAGLELEATVELARSRLYRRYCERVVDLQRIPILTSDQSAIGELDLPPDTGFLLSMLDGRTSLADVISLAGMDAFETLHAVNGLMDAGILELRE